MRMKGEAMDLKLEPKEQGILVWALKSTVSDLGTEIPHTDDRDLHKDLKDRKATLEGILTRLS